MSDGARPRGGMSTQLVEYEITKLAEITHIILRSYPYIQKSPRVV